MGGAMGGAGRICGMVVSTSISSKPWFLRKSLSRKDAPVLVRASECCWGAALPGTCSSVRVASVPGTALSCNGTPLGRTEHSSCESTGSPGTVNTSSYRQKMHYIESQNPNTEAKVSFQNDFKKLSSPCCTIILQQKHNKWPGLQK